MTLDVERLRADTPGCEHVTHLNNAGSSLPPQPVLDANIGHLRREAEIGGYEAHNEQRERVEHTYDALARLIGASRDEIACVENATRAWDMAFYSFRFAPGDRILTGRAEYASNWIALRQVAHTTGATIEVVPDDEHGQFDVAALQWMLDEKVKLVSLVHVPTQGGLVNPAEAVGRVTRAAGVPLLLDACQSVGQLPVDVEAIGCDILSATGRKFLRAPRGTGFLYVRKELIAELEPPFLDMHAAAWQPDGSYTMRDDARRFENWETYVAGKIALGVAADYALELGLDAIWERDQALAERLRERARREPRASRCSTRARPEARSSPSRSPAAAQPTSARRSLPSTSTSRSPRRSRRGSTSTDAGSTSSCERRCTTSTPSRKSTASSSWWRHDRADRPLDRLALRRVGQAARVLLLPLRPPDRRRRGARAGRARGRRRAPLRVGHGRRHERAAHVRARRHAHRDRRRRVLRHEQALRDARGLRHRVRRVRPDRPRPRRGHRLGRGAREPDADPARLGSCSQGHRGLVVCDATVSTPVYLQALERGADIVLHSATKFLTGQHDALLGATVARGEHAERLKLMRVNAGITASPDAASSLLRGLSTLETRMRRHTETATELARRLEAHPAVERVRYPGYSGLISFDVADALAVETATSLIVNATSLGGVHSSLEGRHRWEGDRIPTGLLRLSVGLEDVEALWADLDAALGRTAQTQNL